MVLWYSRIVFHYNYATALSKNWLSQSRILLLDPETTCIVLLFLIEGFGVCRCATNDHSSNNHKSSSTCVGIIGNKVDTLISKALMRKVEQLPLRYIGGIIGRLIFWENIT